MKDMYFLQFSGKSSYDDTAAMDVFQPGSVAYETSTFPRVSKFAASEME